MNGFDGNLRFLERLEVGPKTTLNFEPLLTAVPARPDVRPFSALEPPMFIPTTAYYLIFLSPCPGREADGLR